MNIKHRLIVMNFLQFAVWGAYLTSMGTYLAGIGLGSHIGLFYAMQGIVSLFMPAIMGIKSFAGGRVHAGSGFPWNARRGSGVVSGIVHTVFTQRGFLYADTGLVQLCSLYGSRSVGTGYHQGFSADTYFWNHRIYLFHVAGGCVGLAA